MTPRKERGGLAPANGHRQSKKGNTTEATSVRKDKTKVAEPDAEVKVKTTVVDIDSVRDDEMKDESIGLLEAAEQDGKSTLSIFTFPTF